MTTAHAHDADLTEDWREGESLGRIDFAVATDKLEPGASTGRRQIGSEQVLMVVDGDACAHIDGEATELSSGASVLIPALVSHEIENVGESTLRMITAVSDERAA
jgi:mannose-6-phosphate isomerase-like protein (cupin superfamily)